MTDYYHHTRREIRPLLPDHANRILEIGAGAGATLKWLKSFYLDAETTGVEINAALYEQLKENADVAIIDNIGACLTRLKSYDLILLLDVLEHISDATTLLRDIVNRLEPGGRVIVSVPNVAHLSVSVPLLFQRRFTYRDAGILDRTHVKLFVEDSAIGLLNEANLKVTMGLLSGLQGSKSKLITLLSFGRLKHYLTRQYIMCGERSDVSPLVQHPVQWRIAD
jgi:2-polyprenyl-3-methyl-5-hydroxy-6-metoxy-1,4-benzoquinol methylase